MREELEKKGDANLARVPSAERRAQVLCANCSAVLMESQVLPPGDHTLTCPVCKRANRAEVAGGTLMKVFAAASSAADELHDWKERKRAELRRAIEEGKVNGPLGALVPYIIPLLISTGVSVGLSILQRALSPAQKIQKGSLAGQELRLDRADYGIFIPEILGCPPSFAAEEMERR